ncbi:hypothetical protein DL766_002529 [Monosporascus sp. MC13-8B]|uniref:Major facilitator superfamily (MFS) profile domain-containing protein n=1 Tax=Monosporascus cannonballus TaxID=155416 RepID=A0ABY0GRT8_9PEZI|nr:hypothetical protein DL762_009980 [Monosporascus cannonballus]RYP01033.1 hypothetical protein DL763_000454 [Monosporascus cannonballus]RYP35353.1 hypothetical protein DL766_002529 [Monosporascus sp. MC13-8B]
MEAGVLKPLVEVEPASSQLHTAPGRAVSRIHPAVRHRDDEDIEFQAYSVHATMLCLSTPQLLSPPQGGDPEMGVPGTPTEPADAFEALPSFLDPPMNNFRVATHYSIGYAVVSLIFIGNALGFIGAAPLIESPRLRLGRARALGLSQLWVMCGYIPIVCTAPFPVAVCSYLLIGFGSAVSLAMNNVFCANLRDGTTILGAMHGSYGAGATAAPLIATSLRLVLLGLREGGGRLPPRVVLCVASASSEGDGDATAAGGQPGEPAPAGTRQQLSTMFAASRSQVVLLGALFIFAYQGAEVSISGWATSFLITTREGDLSRMGYATSGFRAGHRAGAVRAVAARRPRGRAASAYSRTSRRPAPPSPSCSTPSHEASPSPVKISLWLSKSNSKGNESSRVPRSTPLIPGGIKPLFLQEGRQRRHALLLRDLRHPLAGVLSHYLEFPIELGEHAPREIRPHMRLELVAVDYTAQLVRRLRNVMDYRD